MCIDADEQSSTWWSSTWWVDENAGRSWNEKSKKLFYLDNINASKNIYYSSIKYNPRVKIIFTNSSQVFKKKYGLVNEKSKTFKRSYYTRFRIDFVNLS